jgi:hypothetical protein
LRCRRQPRRAEADEPKARSRKDAGTKFAWGRRQPGHSAEVDNVDSRDRLRRSEVLESKSESYNDFTSFFIRNRFFYYIYIYIQLRPRLQLQNYNEN